MSTFKIGQKPTLRATFKDEDGALTDPTDVTFKVRQPDGTETSYTTADGVTNDSVGVWSFPMPNPLDAEGRWYWRAVGTGAVVAADEDHFIVDGSAFDTP